MQGCRINLLPRTAWEVYVYIDINPERSKGIASKVARLWQVLLFLRPIFATVIACQSAPILDLHPAGLEPATL
jgi:hypothetical protein